MTGGIMPKVSAVRWAIALSVMLLLAAGTIGFATSLSGRPANDSAPGEDYAGEREAVLHRMREVASRVPPERLPAGIPALLQPVSQETRSSSSPAATVADG